MRELSLFAGAGGGLLASHILGWRTVCAVERDFYCQQVLLQRQRDGMLDGFPIWDDVRTFDGRRWRGLVDVISGGFPCQDISSAGKRAGLDGERSGLWREFARIISETEPAFCFIENSADLVHRGLASVLSDLDRLGYDARWEVVSAAGIGAPHRRKRVWVAAYSHHQRERVLALHAQMGSTPKLTKPISWWPKAVVPGVDARLAHRMERVRATGNGQVPAVAALAWTVLSTKLMEEVRDE